MTGGGLQKHQEGKKTTKQKVKIKRICPEY
jgi:hypothetical protein